jgi:hypothetical protein
MIDFMALIGFSLRLHYAPTKQAGAELHRCQS